MRHILFVLAMTAGIAQAEPKPLPQVCEEATKLNEQLLAAMEEFIPDDPHLPRMREDVYHTKKTWYSFQEEFADDPELEPERRQFIAETLEMGEDMLIDVCQRMVEVMPAIIAEVREHKRLPVDSDQPNNDIEKQHESE